ncbi:hypothetical protein F7725_007960 [Dissostichus mawsoni]|uniref:C-type lectin domain-containing protein n=1 Tax=Dissostichus mawsoni TaxID=36200 RepID=A0A7J5Y827_DISMA|nr:hypothetical protein F7725_007960 [Dissostichus mawsoni]
MAKQENNGSMVTVGSRSLPLYPLVIGFLGLLNTILILTAIVIGIYCGEVSEESAPDQITAQGLIIEVKQLQIMQTEAVQAQKEAEQAVEKELRKHQQLKLQLWLNKTLIDSIQRSHEVLQVDRATLKSNSSDMQESCGRCQSGWLLLNTSCYFHGKSASNPLKNWQDSRADCIRRGADLAMINSLEEQLNLFEILPKMDPSIRKWWSTQGGYWIIGEPTAIGEEEQNCGAFINLRNPRKTLFDDPCESRQTKTAYILIVKMDTENAGTFDGSYNKLIHQEDISGDELTLYSNQEQEQDGKFTDGQDTIMDISAEVAKLQAAYDTAIWHRDEAKKQLAREIMEQQITKWELDHQKSRSKDYLKLSDKIQMEIAALKSHIPMISEGFFFSI